MNISLHAGPCTGMRCSIDRSRHSLSICAASRGKCSQSWMPGTRVAIGLNSPRISTGASGFMSHRSMWLGPPNRKMKMHELNRPGAAGQRRPAAAAQAGQIEAASSPAGSSRRRATARAAKLAPSLAAESKIENMRPIKDREHPTRRPSHAVQAIRA